ncbi:MAG: cyclic pyranopterin monophosphate synthase MoaC [Acidiferrobacterales bacterium]|nr:cyclic pyranopterin monophosphate synthase MoaC [Acidiferrobacterales bacterium]
MSKLTHFNEQGDAHMVDVGEKQPTARRAVAEGRIRMSLSTVEQIISSTNKKGDVLGVARLAGIMAAKKTSDLVPLCHPLSLTHVTVDLECDRPTSSVYCRAATETRDRTGVEIEALTAVQVALLTVYDMCKATDRGMIIESVQLIEKSGGRSGHWKRKDG